MKQATWVSAKHRSRSDDPDDLLSAAQGDHFYLKGELFEVRASAIAGLIFLTSLDRVTGNPAYLDVHVRERVNLGLGRALFNPQDLVDIIGSGNYEVC